MVDVQNEFQDYHVAKRDGDATSWAYQAFVILAAFNRTKNDAKPIEALPYDEVR